MRTARPWTEGLKPLPWEGDLYLVGENDVAVVEIWSEKSEADARLFAAADAMYTALEKCRREIACKLSTPEGEDSEADLLGAYESATAALRAANPEAFTPTVPASEPEGETK